MSAPTETARAGTAVHVLAREYPVPIVGVDRWSSTTAHGRLTSIIATVGVDGSDPALAGHFPDLKIFPGVFVLETLSQALSEATGTPQRLRELLSAKFLRPLLAGDVLTLEAEVTATGKSMVSVNAVGIRQDGVVAVKVRARFGGQLTAPEVTDPGSAGPTPMPPGAASMQPEASAFGGLAPMSYAEIRRLLPQRHPLLLVDRVEHFEVDRRIETIKLISGSEPSFMGPDLVDYAYPTSLMLESFGQSAALLWLRSAGIRLGAEDVLMFVAARSCRFLAEVYPGETLRHQVTIDSVIADTAFASGTTSSAGRIVASYDSIVAVRRPRETPAVTSRHPDRDPAHREYVPSLRPSLLAPERVAP